ncbi:LysR family transcriptional regulator [Mesorhizobium sp. M1076]|uniref:LysR family transcriptional regulator n=1 Tax=Mesorhizobium sp. M1076 TaxID=2957054 RepID=UPI00333DF802
MNLRDIDVFNAIMITRGAGAAAALLDTSQPAISRSLAKLEAELGFRLSTAFVAGWCRHAKGSCSMPR